MTKTLVTVALEREMPREKWKFNLPIIYTGIGKINVSLKLIDAIRFYKPSCIINLGSAGSLDLNLIGVVEVSKVFERDFDASPLIARGLIPYENHENFFESNYPGVICGSGDNFLTKKNDNWLTQKGIEIVDMELFPTAKICHTLGVAWRSFKFITDYVGHSQDNKWETEVDRIAHELCNKVSEQI